MKRISSPNGSQVNFESTVDNIQQKAFSNLLNRLNMLIEQTGVSLQVTNDTVSDELKASLTNLGSNISVQPGKALTSSGEYISIPNAQPLPNPVGATDNSGHGIVITYKELSTNPVKALNAFVYDKLDSQAINRKTVHNDSFTLTTEAITGTLAQFKETLGDNQILLAAVWRTAGTFSEVTSYPESVVGDFTIADLREDTRMVLSSSLLSDDTILFKDRPSVGDNAFPFNIEFSSNLYFNNIEPSSGGVGTLSVNEIIMTDGNLKKTNISGTTSQDFWVGVDPNEGLMPTGKRLVVSDGNLSNPSRLRVHGINGTNNRNEHYSLVTFRWNWDHLKEDSATGSLTVGNEFVIIAPNTFEGNTSNITTAVVGKKLLFTSSNNSYNIEAITDNKLFLDKPIVAGDTVSETNPMRIVDINTKQYVFSVKDSANGEAKILLLDESYVKKPQISIKLPLDETFNYSIQGMNNSGLSNTDTGDTLINILDVGLLNAEGGTMTLEATGTGFTVHTTGWPSSQQREIVISSETDLSSVANPFADLSSGNKIHRITDTHTELFVSGQPTEYSVALRPLINGAPVGDTIFGRVQSGGGGVYPDDRDFIDQFKFNIRVYDGAIATDLTEPTEFDAEWYDPYDPSVPIRLDDGFMTGRGFTRLDINGDPIGRYRVNEVRSRTDNINGRQRIRVLDPTGLGGGDPIATGVTKEDRLITEKDLPFEYIVKSMQIKLDSITGVSTDNGAIIRVYQKGREALAAVQEIEAFSESTITTELTTQDLNFEILKSQGPLTIVVDAFDPDGVSPNNRASISGTLTVRGRPKLIDKI